MASASPTLPGLGTPRRTTAAARTRCSDRRPRRTFPGTRAASARGFASTFSRSRSAKGAAQRHASASRAEGQRAGLYLRRLQVVLCRSRASSGTPVYGCERTPTTSLAAHECDCQANDGCRSGTGGNPLELLFQGVQEAAHTLGAPGRGLVAVEERTLLGEDHVGATVAHRCELHRGQRDGDPRPVQEHLVGVDDALGRDDVVEERLIAVGAATRRGAAAPFPPA